MMDAARVASAEREEPASHYHRLRWRVEQGEMTEREYEAATKERRETLRTQGGPVVEAFISYEVQRRRMLISELAARPGRWGGGRHLGARLLRAAVEDAAQGGARVEEVHLIVRAEAMQQERARDLYERMGFKERDSGKRQKRMGNCREGAGQAYMVASAEAVRAAAQAEVGEEQG